MKKLSKTLFNNELLKNISILASGTVLAQLIPIALQPYLRRQFSAEDYGAYSVYLSLVGILIIISSFKYELAIILPKKRKEAANVLFLSQFLNLIFNFFLIVVIFIWDKQITGFLNLKGVYKNYIYFVPLGTFVYNFYQAINYWLIREKKFLLISKNKLIRRSAEGSTQIVFSLMKNNIGLIIGDILGNTANLAAGLSQTLKNGLHIKFISIVKLKYVAKKYFEYPKINLIPSLMSAGSFLLPAILINKFFSMEYAGYFDLSKMVLSIPLALVAVSVSNVLLQKIDEKLKLKKGLVKTLFPLLGIISFIAIMEIIVISLFGEELFSLFFGQKNVFSGKIAEIMVWSDAFSFISASFSSIYIAMKKIKYLSIWQIFYFGAIIFLFFLNNLQFIRFLEIYVIIKASFHFISILLMIYIVFKYQKDLTKTFN